MAIPRTRSPHFGQSVSCPESQQSNWKDFGSFRNIVSARSQYENDRGKLVYGKSSSGDGQMAVRVEREQDKQERRSARLFFSNFWIHRTRDWIRELFAALESAESLFTLRRSGRWLNESLEAWRIIIAQQPCERKRFIRELYRVLKARPFPSLDPY